MVKHMAFTSVPITADAAIQTWHEPHIKYAHSNQFQGLYLTDTARKAVVMAATSPQPRHSNGSAYLR